MEEEQGEDEEVERRMFGMVDQPFMKG